MSLTARERHNPPTRCKSCAACIKAKRRCDFAFPACLRCSQRNLACQYPIRNHRAAPTQTLPTPPAPLVHDFLVNDVLSSPPIAIDDFNLVNPSLDPNFDDLGGLDFTLDQETLDMIHQPATSTMLAPPAVKDFGFLTWSIQNRLQWAITEIQKAPATMVYETQTPWCHPLLYKDGMPRSVQDAHASCALYLAKNRTNGPVIFRSIESRVYDLLNSPAPVTARDCLAHTHALILYQIIRLLDGDISARGAAERNLSDLEDSALVLLGYVNWDIDEAGCELPIYPMAPTKAFWQDWIFQESVRRTLLITFYFTQAYRVLAGQKSVACDGKLGLCHSWTLSAHLWKAMTPLAFADAWQNKKHFILKHSDFAEVWNGASADDVDTYGRIFISSYLGVEEAEGWFASRGGKL